MHQLPAASWFLIILSTAPWLAWTVVHYVRNARGVSDADVHENRN